MKLKKTLVEIVIDKKVVIMLKLTKADEIILGINAKSYWRIWKNKKGKHIALSLNIVLKNITLSKG